MIAFDVNETPLDLPPLESLFVREVGDPAVRVQCFAQVPQIAVVSGLTGRHIDFTSAQRASPTMPGLGELEVDVGSALSAACGDGDGVSESAPT